MTLHDQLTRFMREEHGRDRQAEIIVLNHYDRRVLSDEAGAYPYLGDPGARDGDYLLVFLQDPNTGHDVRIEECDALHSGTALLFSGYLSGSGAKFGIRSLDV